MLNENIKRLDAYGNPKEYTEFVWNKRKHFPIIKLEYLASEYNINYEEEMNITNTEALRDLREIADLSYDILLRTKRSDSKDYFLYYVAKDDEILFKVLELQVMLLRSYMMTGSIADIFDSESYTLPLAITNYLESSGLNHPFWIANKVELPVGVDY